MPKNSASRLFQRCLDEQSDEVWSLFQQRYGRYLERVVRRAVLRHGMRLRRHQIEELLQELFCRVLDHRPRFSRSDRQLWAYFSQVALNLLVDRYRRALYRRKRLALIRGGAGSEWLRTKLVLEEVPTPEDIALYHDGWRQLITLAARVVRPDRRPLELRALRMALIEGYSSHEISQATGGRLKPRRVDRLVFRLRRKLLAAGLGRLPRRFTSRHQLHKGRFPRGSGVSQCERVMVD